jgi:diphthine synthase
MLTFVGLGLYDERSITLRGRDALRDADRAFAECYTSRLAGASIDDLEAAHDVTITVRGRAGVEQDPQPILDAAADGDCVFLTAGDPLVATTHVDLRLRAHDRGIDTRVVHGVSAQSAASGLTGLQNYRFGPSVTLPFPEADGGAAGGAADDADRPAVPDSVLETIAENRERDCHTLVFLDIDADGDRYLTADRAAAALAGAGGRDGLPDDPLGVAVARAGSDEPVVAADRLAALSERDLGPPLHLLVLPASLHHMEAEALAAFADAPAELLPTA